MFQRNFHESMGLPLKYLCTDILLYGSSVPLTSDMSALSLVIAFILMKCKHHECKLVLQQATGCGIKYPHTEVKKSLPTLLNTSVIRVMREGIQEDQDFCKIPNFCFYSLVISCSSYSFRIAVLVCLLHVFRYPINTACGGGRSAAH